MPSRGGVGSGRCTRSPYRGSAFLRVRPAIMRSPTTAASRGSSIRSNPPRRSESTTLAGPLTVSFAWAADTAARSNILVRRDESLAAASLAAASSPAALSSAAIARRTAAMSSSVGWSIVGPRFWPAVTLIPEAATRSRTAVASEAQFFQAARSMGRERPDGSGGRPSAFRTTPAAAAPPASAVFSSAAVGLRGRSPARWAASGSRERSRTMRSWSGIRTAEPASAVRLESS